jgi:hypothetical protein
VAKKHDRKRLFVRQATNFSHVKSSFPNLKVSPDIPGMIMCPLCFQVVMLDADETSLVSLEHAPPSQLGGKVVGLTCKDCNNTHGTTLDSKLIEYYRVTRSLVGDGSRFTNANLQVNELPPIRVNFNIAGNNSWQMFPIVKASNPDTIAKVNHIFERTQKSPYEKFSLVLQFDQPHDRIVRVALIRAAYLIAFGQFGYGFVVSPALNYIRHLFRAPQDEALYPHGVMFRFPISDEFLGVSIITQPIELKSYLVVFDLVAGGKHLDRIGVILPGWTNDPMSLYRYLDSINKQQVSISMHKIVDKIDFFTKAPLATLWHWNTLFADSEL